VLVLESRARLGGRATAFTDRETGEVVDNGQHVLLGCYTATFEFLRLVGAIDHVRIAPQLAVTMIDRQGQRSRLVCPSHLPAPLHLLAGVLEWDALAWADKWSAVAMRTPIKLARKEIGSSARRKAASDGETVENWLIRNGQTARIREMLWEPLALAALNQPPNKAAAPTFARVIGEMFGSDPQAAAIVLPTTPLHAMYAEPARAFIESHGGEVRTGATAKLRIAEPPAGGRSRADNAIVVEANGGRWTPKSVVSAVPWFAFADLFDAMPPQLAPVADRARRMDSSPIVSVNLWFDRPVIDEPFIGLPGRTMQWVFDKRIASGAREESRHSSAAEHTSDAAASRPAHEAVGGEASHVSLVSSGAADIIRQTNDELIQLAHRELLEALPDARRAKLVRTTVVREPRATFSLAPGQPARPPVETGVRGLFLAGDWIDTGLPATIESAVRSAHRAADLSIE
jgi:squalene-associated FAD-dependent desaturase